MRLLESRELLLIGKKLERVTAERTVGEGLGYRLFSIVGLNIVELEFR
jgi:hypothetical protein